ncbi:MAG: hypothetical protein ABJA67_07070 [Chthonomonadales bacterium]
MLNLHLAYFYSLAGVTSTIMDIQSTPFWRRYTDARTYSDMSATKKKRLKAGLLVLFFSIGSVFCTYSYNNRPIHYRFTKHDAPKNNALGDFTKASTAFQNIHVAGLGKLYIHEYPSKQDLHKIATESYEAIQYIKSGLSKPLALPEKKPKWVNDGFEFRMHDLFLATSMYLENQGKYPEAIEARLLGMEFEIKMSKSGPIMAKYNLALSISELTTNINVLINKLTPQQLSQVAERLTTIRGSCPEFRDDVDGMKDLWIQSIIQEQKKDKIFISKFIEFRHGGNNSWASNVSWMAEQFQDKTAMVRDVTQYLDQIKVEVSGPYHLVPQTKSPKSLTNIGWSQPLWAWNIPLSARSSVELLRLEVALQNYKLEHNKFPATLAQVAPSYMPSVPLDPLAGEKPYKYRVKSDGNYLLYGAGPDMKDYGGHPAKFLGLRGGDMVAGKLGFVFSYNVN